MLIIVVISWHSKTLLVLYIAHFVPKAFITSCVFRFGEMFGRNSYGISERVWTHWITLKFLRWWMVPITPHHLDLEGVTKLRHEEALFKFFAAPKLNFRTPFYGVVTNELFCCSKHGRRCLVSDVAACFRDHP